MEYSDLISALIAIVAVIISLISLQRTRRFQERELQLQEEVAKLSRLQREEIERTQAENDRQAREAAARQAEKMRQDEEERVKGRIHVYSGIFHGVVGFGVRNLGDVPVHDVEVQPLAGSALAEDAVAALEASFPICALHPGETVLVKARLQGEVLVSWTTSAGRLEAHQVLY